jgi:hypothetical protein
MEQYREGSGLSPTAGMPLNLRRLEALTRPVLSAFEQVEPKLWDRSAVLVELAGEIGSLAHQVQLWDGFKNRRFSRLSAADECSDILFVLIRLAYVDKLLLPVRVESDNRLECGRGADRMLSLCSLFSKVVTAERAAVHDVVEMIRRLVELSVLLGIDLEKAHEIEMAIAGQYLATVGSGSRLAVIKHPFLTFRLWSSVRRRKRIHT